MAKTKSNRSHHTTHRRRVMRLGTMGTTSPRLDRKEHGGLPRVGLLGLTTWARRPVTEAV
jgi:hypothetical protein